MKSLLFSLITLAVLIASCKKDEPCNPGSLQSTIVGNWTLHVAGVDYGDVEFKADGTLIDPDSIMINPDSGTGEILDLLSYEVVSETAFSTFATNAAGNTTVYSDYEVKSFTCDEIVLDNFVVDVTLNRK